MFMQREPTTLRPTVSACAQPREEGLFRGAVRLPECEEDLIVDDRANLGPAEVVEHKLSSLLRSALLPVSHVRMAALCGRRRPCCG